ncbi:MAG: hypothetical protein RLY31_656 [Bacteroidota bacterium]|jgi:hypothetical protein
MASRTIGTKGRWGLAVLVAACWHLLYHRTLGAGFVTDYTGLLDRMEGASAWKILDCFGFPALHQLTNAGLYLMVRSVGSEPLPWYLLHTSLHLLNGWLVYRLAFRWFRGTAEPAVMAALLFLFSPYQSEAVTWKVCFNFLTCTAWCLGALLWLDRFLRRGGRPRDLAGFQLSLAAALFTFELALALPLLAAVWYLRVRWTEPVAGRSRRRELQVLLLPQLVILAGYFLTARMVLGHWVGHYGPAVHLRFVPAELAANVCRYFLKYLVFWREYPYRIREAVVQACGEPIWLMSAAGLLVLLTVLALYRKTDAHSRSGILVWALFLAALAPLANLYVAWMQQGENDRYGYLASVFFFMGLAGWLWRLRWPLCYLLFAGWFLSELFFLDRLNTDWARSATVVRGLLADYRWQADGREIYLLAFPENYKGLPMFRDYSGEDLSWRHALRYLSDGEIPGRVHQVAQYNMNLPEDGVQARWKDSVTLEMTFLQWGNWWWRNGVGTLSYETDRYRFEVEGNGALLTFRSAPGADALFLYVSEGRWRELPPWGRQGTPSR